LPFELRKQNTIQGLLREKRAAEVELTWHDIHIEKGRELG
jgi:hypothetical protein